MCEDREMECGLMESEDPQIPPPKETSGINRVRNTSNAPAVSIRNNMEVVTDLELSALWGEFQSSQHDCG